MAANYTVSATFEAVDKMSNRLARMQKANTSFSRKVQTSFANIEMAARKAERRISSMFGKLGKLGLGFSALMIAQQVAMANVELDKSLQSLQAITGVTGAAFESFEKQIDSVSKKQMIFAGDTAKAFELVGSAKPELLENAAALAEVTEQAIILGKAGKLETTEAVNALTVALNQFGAGADKAAMFTDILATAQQKGSGPIRYLQEAIIRSGSTMATFNVEFEDTVAILEGYAKSGIEASVAGTALASIMGRLAKSQRREFNPQFTNAIDIIDNLAKANLSYTEVEKLVGAQQAKNLLALIKQNETVQNLSGNLYELGNAQEQANIQSSSLSMLWQQIVDQFKNAVTTTDSNSESMLKLKSAMVEVAKNMDNIVAFAIKGIKIFIGYKAAIIGVKIAQSALAAVMAVQNFFKYLRVIQKVTKANTLWAAAQWYLNAAMNANIISIIIIAIIALIAAVVLLVKNWKKIVNWVKTSDSWFAKLIRGALRPIVFLFKLIGKLWKRIMEGFKSGRIGGFFRKIGLSIYNFLIAPLEIALKIANKLSKGRIGGDMLENLDSFRAKFEQPQELTTNKTAAAIEQRNYVETIQKQEASLTIKKEPGVETEEEIPFGFPVKLEPTF